MKSQIILLILVSASCRELVTDEFSDFKPIPVVNCILITGETVKVHVSLAEKLDTTILPLINNAIVSLYSDGVFEENLSPVGNGIYISSLIAKPSRKYNCTVTIPGYEEISCCDSIPSVPSISSIEHINEAGKDEEGRTYPAIRVTFKNDTLRKLYFEIVIRLLQNNHERIANLEVITDPVLLNEGLPLTIFSNDYIKEVSYSMLINYTTGSAEAINGEPIHTKLYPLIVELRSVSYCYYQFVKQKYLYELGRYPEFMVGPIKVYPLFSNVPGGYGLFAGYAVMKSDTIYPAN